MKEIKLKCFDKNETCRIVSDFKNFSISSPTENQYLLEVVNQGENDCNVEIELKKIEQNTDLTQVKLLITKENELFFHDNLEIFFKQKIFLGKVKNKTSNKYFLTFDFMNLSLENKKINLNFDLSLNFNCNELVEEVFISEGLSNHQALQKENKSAVLAASDNKNESTVEENNSFFSSPAFYLLSSLFIVVFFVIIKVVNGKKKKNTE